MIESKSQNLQKENKRLRQAVEELAILNDLARTICASLNSQEIMETIIRRSMLAVHAEQGVITLVDIHTSEPTKTLVRTIASSSKHPPFHLSQTLVGWMLLNKKPLQVNQPQKDDRFPGVIWEKSIDSLVCVPLMVKSELIGILTLYNKKEEKKFTEDDERLLAIIAAQSAQVVENARLYEEEKALSQIQQELQLAYQIQLSLLPKTFPHVAGYDIAGKSIPAKSVGGDYYDFIPMEENRIAICIGDVSGKGLPSALLMANLQATIRGQTRLNTSACDCLNRANVLLYESTAPDKFATLFYGILDTQTHQYYYSNAGHNPPLLFRENPKPTDLRTGGIVLGFVDNYSFIEGVISFNPSDLLLLYSDGVTEAVNELEESFGEQRLISLCESNRNKPAKELIENIIAEVQMHSADSPQTDDMTLVIIKRT